jgi:hypothetical protein
MSSMVNDLLDVEREREREREKERNARFKIHHKHEESENKLDSSIPNNNPSPELENRQERHSVPIDPVVQMSY